MIRDVIQHYALSAGQSNLLHTYLTYISTSKSQWFVMVVDIWGDEVRVYQCTLDCKIASVFSIGIG